MFEDRNVYVDTMFIRYVFCKIFFKYAAISKDVLNLPANNTLIFQLRKFALKQLEKKQTPAHLTDSTVS